MNEDRDSLPEDAARRLLARAAELDAAQTVRVQVAQLRDVAREAGISAPAFEAALDEIRTEAAMPRRAAKVSVFEGWWKTLATNVVVFVACWGTLMILARLCRVADADWQLQKAAEVAALVVGAGLAYRLRARIALFVLAGLALAQGAECAMDLAFHGPAVDGAGAHLALMIAGVCGVALGALLTRKPPVAPPTVPTAGRATRPLPNAGTTRRTERTFLRFGLSST